jgi:hypothetical protein
MNDYKTYFYKRSLKKTALFILNQIDFALFHLKLLGLNDEYENRIIAIENEVNSLLNDMNHNEIFKGDDEK